MDIAAILGRAAAELALFAGAGFLLFGINDLVVDLIYFVRAFLAFADDLQALSACLCKLLGVQRKPGLHRDPGAGLGRSLGDRLDAASRRSSGSTMTITGSSSAIIATIRRPPRRSPASTIRASSRSQVEADGPTTKADCLNHLYDALIAFEIETGRSAKAVVLHDAEDVVHRFELRIFDGLIDRAAVIQLPVLPLIDPHSRWISGHYCDEFAEAHIKELVVREADRRGHPAGRRRLRDRPQAARRSWPRCRTASRSRAAA